MHYAYTHVVVKEIGIGLIIEEGNLFAELNCFLGLCVQKNIEDF